MPLLVDAGYDVSVLVRRPERVASLAWAPRVRLCAGDAVDAEAVRAALEGVHTAFYLLHSIGTGPDFDSHERQMADTFAAAAADAGVTQIVYLGGLANDDALSQHLSSRVAVGEALASHGIAVLELRAGVILGSGSASFEMLRYLTERLPVMVAPRWIDNRIQPIAVADVLGYLAAAAGLDQPVKAVCDIGGPDVITYREMMERYAQLAGLHRRHIIRVGVLTPQLSSHWVGLVTPVPSNLAKPLVRSLINDAVCAPEHPVHPALARDELITFDDAVQRALRTEASGAVQTRWSDANGSGDVDWALPAPSDPEWSGGTTLEDARRVHTTANRDALWAAVECIGGTTGWYGADWAWGLRGFADRITGGVGLRRGRRDPHHVRVGDAVDFWRVEAHEPGQRLRLRAEMRLPGDAWLEFTIESADTGLDLVQRAWFRPRGLLGLAYWYTLAPFHAFVFPGMARGIVEAAEARGTTAS